MQPNKVYESLAHLTNNIIKNEKLRFELFDKDLFKDQFVKQINNMLALEKDFNQELNGEKWATIFAKAVVKIIGKKQRFEKPDGRSIEEIYADYSAFISYTTTTFMVGRNELVDDSIKFSEQDVLYNAVLSDITKENYRNLEAQKAQTEQLAKEQKEQGPQNDNSKANNNYQQSNNQQSSYFGGNFGPQQGFAGMPIHPMQDPRFYPYNAKPKWMSWMKYILAIVAIVSAIMLVVASAIMMSVKLNFEDVVYGNALFKNATVGNGTHPIWNPNNPNWNDFIGKHNGEPILNDFPFNWALMQPSIMTIFGFLFYLIPAAYVAYYAFRKPRNLSDKYRLQLWPLFLIILFFALSLFSIYNFVSPNSIKGLFVNTYKKFLLNPKDVGEGFSYDFDGFWNVVMDKNNYGTQINAITTVVDVAIGVSSVAILFGIVLWIINPRLDREKVAQANMEFQKAAMAAMQGQTYEMNQSLYENDDETVNHKPSKFSVWWQKTFKKRNYDKNKPKD